MSLRNAILTIIDSIPSGEYFDSHYVIQNLIKNHSEEYLTFCKHFWNTKIMTNIAHAQLGTQIMSVCKGLNMKKIDSKVISSYVHKSRNNCAIFLKK